MNTMQQTDYQHGEIFSIGFRPCMWYAEVCVKNGRVSELVRVELSEKEYRHIYAADVEKTPIDSEIESAVIDRAKNLAACFQ